MLQVNGKKVMVLALAGMFGFGIAGMSMTNVAEAAIKPAYEDGTHNQYSHRMSEEDRVHRQNVLSLKYQKRHSELTEKEFDKKMKEEQKRHDRVVREIKDDYNHHNHYRH
ncbi:hypothetical protein [Selenomonas sp.]|uniref:hypothetical protein n=1 Tax=Selenomonas sp. TaxID=2053611 RepID=UPI0025E41504|nr:hypothetical protein [Selenomonas sp.]